MDGLHIGLVGVGRIGAMHARTLSNLRDVARLTIADADFGRARVVADDVGAGAAETPEALVAAGVDALVIATATGGHAALLRVAAQARVPAFCEKPVALDLPTLDGVIEEVGRSGILVQVGFQRRFDAGYRAAREAVASGAVGTILTVRAATHDPAPPAREYVAASGGMFRDLAIHDFDAIRFVTGQDVVESPISRRSARSKRGTSRPSAAHESTPRRSRSAQRPLTALTRPVARPRSGRRKCATYAYGW